VRRGSIPALLLVLTAAGCGGAAAQRPAPSAEQAAVAPDRLGGAGAQTQTQTQTRTRAPSTGAGAGTRAVAVRRRAKPPPAHPIPASFRDAGISPGAPSDAQVRAELAQMYVAQARARKLSADAANFAGLLPWVDEQKSGERVSVASVFTDYGLGLACGGVLGRFQIGVAHKTAPCGTLIDFTYGGRTLRVPVVDRGPYIVGREWDLTGATAEALGFPGLGPIAWRCASC
jgi:rare lipoprotein A (peptidoglycan hydrolase)